MRAIANRLYERYIFLHENKPEKPSILHETKGEFCLNLHEIKGKQLKMQGKFKTS